MEPSNQNLSALSEYLSRPTNDLLLLLLSTERDTTVGLGDPAALQAYPLTECNPDELELFRDILAMRIQKILADVGSRIGRSRPIDPALLPRMLPYERAVALQVVSAVNAEQERVESLVRSGPEWVHYFGRADADHS